MPANTAVGSVTRERYEEIVTEDRKLIETDTKIQFKIGDHALEIEPMHQHGGSQAAAGEELGVRQTLEMYAEDIGVSYNTVRINRHTASRWPAEYRAAGVSFEIHRILEQLEDRSSGFSIRRGIPVTGAWVDAGCGQAAGGLAGGVPADGSGEG